METNEDRTEYRSSNGIAAWWQKDGLWHIAIPCPHIVNGLKTGGFMWTEHEFRNRDSAINAINSIADLQE